MLSLLSREKRDRKTGEPRRLTMREAAKVIGVSDRTLRRWKNEGVQPSAIKRAAAAKLLKESTTENRRIAAAQAADRRKHPKAIRLDAKKLRVIPRAHRRTLKRYKHDKKKGRTVATGESYDSNWANYDVRGWSFAEISALLVQVWKSGHPFQFIYEVPAGGQLPKSGGKPSRTVKKTTRASTAPINPGGFDDESELLSFLNNYIDYEQTRKGRRLMFIAVDDNRSGARK